MFHSTIRQVHVGETLNSLIVVCHSFVFLVLPSMHNFKDIKLILKFTCSHNKHVISKSLLSDIDVLDSTFI